MSSFLKYRMIQSKVKSKVSVLINQCVQSTQYFFSFFFVCFTSYFVFSIAVLRHSPGVVYYLLFSNRNLGSFCALGTEILYTHSLWEVVDHSRSKMHGTLVLPFCKVNLLSLPTQFHMVQNALQCQRRPTFD